jgi:hypothetical protein
MTTLGAVPEQRAVPLVPPPPKVYPVIAEYHRLGTEAPQHVSLDELERLGQLFEAGDGSKHIKARYNAWIQYDLGLAKDADRPEEAGWHYIKSMTEMRRSAHPTDNFRYPIERDRHTHITRLLWARLDLEERQTGQQTQVTTAEMGKLVVASVATIRGMLYETDTQASKIRRGVWGLMVETAAAGVVLSLVGQHSKSLWLPALASPRQDSPHVQNEEDRQSSNIAIDLNIMGYEGATAAPAAIIPTQVKTKKADGEATPYHSSTMMLYGDEHLGITRLHDWEQLGRDLQDWPDPRTSVTLSLAQVGVSYAIETHLGLNF